MWLHPALEPLLQLQAHARPDFGCGHISISNLGSGLVWGSFWAMTLAPLSSRVVTSALAPF